MKILVCGGRGYNNKDKVDQVLSSIYNAASSFCVEGSVDCVIQGGADGADNLARIWAEKRGIESVTYPAMWKIYGKSAGPIRNRQMLAENPDISLVVAFPGGKGTEGMIKLAIDGGFQVMQVED